MNNEETFIPYDSIIINPSFPRSGWNFHLYILRDYLDERFCPYDSHTKKCVGKNKDCTPNYIKTHDFYLRGYGSQEIISPDDASKFVVLYRHPLESITSYYEFILAHNPSRFKNGDTLEQWNLFYKETIEYWKNFVEKWVLNLNGDNVIKIQYSQLIESPINTIGNLIKFITERNSYASDRLEEIIKKYKRSNLRDISTFKYFSKEFFMSEERALSNDYLKKLNIPLLFLKSGEQVI